MATFTRVKTWVSNEVLTAADLNGEFNNILNNMTPAGIEDISPTVSDMQTTADPGAVGTEILPTSLTGELQALRYVIKRIVAPAAQWYSAPLFNLSTQIATASIANLAVTTAKIDNLAVTTGKIADSAVTTDKIADGAVTAAKFAPVGQQISAAGGGSTTSATLVDVTNLSVPITTGGKAVFIQLMNDGANSGDSYIGNNGAANQVETIVALLRDGSELMRYSYALRASAGTYDIRFPTSSFSFIDVPAAGTYTYKIQFLSTFGTTAVVSRAKLIAYEIK